MDFLLKPPVSFILRKGKVTVKYCGGKKRADSDIGRIGASVET